MPREEGWYKQAEKKMKIQRLDEQAVTVVEMIDEIGMSVLRKL